MVISVELDERTEAVLREHADRLHTTPQLLAGQVLHKAAEQASLFGELADGEVDDVPAWMRAVCKVFPGAEMNPPGGENLRFGEFRGLLGDLSDEDFRLAEYRDP